MDLMDTPITIGIIIITVLISIRAQNDPDLKYKLVFYPYRIKKDKQQYRFFSHMFIHGDYVHLFFNMFVLFSFGRIMELILVYEFGELFGRLHYLVLYIIGGLVAGLWPFFRNHNNPNYMSLGASGAVSAALFATILWLPSQGLYVMFIPIEIKAWLFGFIYLGFEYYMSKRNANTGVAHDAHFGGAIFGVFYILLIAPYKGLDFINYLLQ